MSQVTQITLLSANHLKPAGVKASEYMSLLIKRKSITMNKTTRQHLFAEMELAKSLMKLSPDEGKKEVYVELKAIEMERRQRVALETKEKSKRDREERENVTESRRRQREEKEKMRLEKMKQTQLKEERLQWNEVMMVEEIKRPGLTLSALKKEHERRREEAELCLLPAAREEADPESRASFLKSAGGEKKTLYNNWVGENTTDSVKEKIGSNSSIYLLFAAKEHTHEEKTKTPKHKMVQWMQDRLKVGHSDQLRSEVKDHLQD